MTEKQMEGLEAGEILDELEVPTAALVVNTLGEVQETDYLVKNFNKDDQLVLGEDHREALREAVQQARERERRRILENLQTKLYQLDWIQILQEAIESRPSSWGYPDRNVETENGFDHPVIEWRNASDELISPIWNQLEEELEEEVSEDAR